MSTVDNLAKDLYKVMNASDKSPKPYDTRATVVRVDTDEPDKLWVHIPGGIEETEVRKTIDAKVGDSVQVRVSGGRAWVTGNSTAPPTDDTKANEANAKANDAKQSADSARDAARKAWDYADDAHNAAVSAQESADAAAESAREAKTDATTANNAATDALFQLSEVENVLDTVNWITEHGYYQTTADTSPISYKVYYTLNGTQVPNPTGSPRTNQYYEIVNNRYVRSTDNTVDPNKTYYQVVQQPVRNVDPEASPAALGYYELVIDQSLEQYVSTHLAVTDRGLWIIPDGNPDSSVTKVLVSASGPDAGVTIFGTSGQPLAKYGSSTLIGDPSKSNIKISDEKVAFCQGNEEVAYVSGQELYITRTVVLDRMQLNNKWVWQYDDTDQSIFLKWIG